MQRTSFDYIVGARDKRWQNFKADRSLRSFLA
jgi:hypothetical protein